MPKRIYLDHAATTPLAREARAAMLPWLGAQDGYGNPSSIHAEGRAARTALDSAREAVAGLIGADFSEITFTSGGTEADNLGLIGAVTAAAPDRDELVISAIEHHAVLGAATWLEKRGCRVTRVRPGGNGIVDPAAIAAAVTDRTALVSVMAVNNEIGAIQPVKQIAEVAHRRGALFHTDAVQAAGSLSLDVREIGCDLLSLSAHKIYGPKGAGALYSRQGVRLDSILHGGGQERERRPGTENVAAIVGFGAAAQLAREHGQEESSRIQSLRDLLIRALQEQAPGCCLNGDPVLRAPGNVNVCMPNLDGAALVMRLDREGIAVSSGAACSSGAIEPSHVLLALGLSRKRAGGGVRFTLGRGNTGDEIYAAARAYGRAVRALQAAR